MTRSKTLAVLCAVTATLAVPGDGRAFRMGSPSSGSCRAERIDDPVYRELTQCTITAATGFAAVAGQLSTNVIRPGGIERAISQLLGPQLLSPPPPRATFEGPDVSRNWTGGAVRELVPVTPGEQYVLTLYVEGTLGVTTGVSEADQAALASVAAWGIDYRPVTLAGIEIYSGNSFFCQLAPPGAPNFDRSSGRVDYEAILDCAGNVSFQLGFLATLCFTSTNPASVPPPSCSEVDLGENVYCGVPWYISCDPVIHWVSKGDHVGASGWYGVRGKAEFKFSSLMLFLPTPTDPFARCSLNTTTDPGKMWCDTWGPYDKY